jgi:hypothetical protein
MHRLIQDHLDEVLAESNSEGLPESPVVRHLAECSECRDEVSAMRRHAAMLQTLRPNGETLAPRPGFYARVMERIEAQRPIDIWQLFFDSAFARRIAIGSMAVALIFSLYLVSSESAAQPVTISIEEDHPGMTLSKAGLPDTDTVLVDLVTYREQ